MISHSTPFAQEVDTEILIESIIQQNFSYEEGDELDIIPLRIELENLYQHPININTKEIRKLAELGVISNLQLAAIQNYIEKYGKIIALEEMMQIQELNKELLLRIKPFIYFDGISEAQKTSFNKLSSQSKYDLTLHYQRVIQKSKAYDKIEPIYLGDPVRTMLKFSAKFYKKWRIGINFEKDAGESYYWNSKKAKLGFDHNSAFISYQGNGILKKGIIGDFQCGFGQGLTFWRAFSFNKSSNSVSIRKVNAGIRPHTGLDEYNFLRGAAFHFSIRNLSLTTLFSLRNLDANQNDSTFSSFSSIIKSGYHRSQNEKDKVSNLKEMIWASHFNYSLNRLAIGLSFVQQSLSSTQNPKSILSSIHQFSGSTNYTIGLNGEYQLKNGHVFYEVSRGSNSAMSYIIGSVISPDPRFSFSLLHRVYSKNFQSISSNAFGESSLNQNETGFYTGIEFHPIRKLRINAFYDIFQFQWIKSRIPFPSTGSEFIVKVDYKKSKMQNFSFRYRMKQVETKNTFSNALMHKTRHQLRIDYSQNVHSFLKFHYRLELHKVKQLERSTGYLFFIDFILQSPAKPYSISARYAIFNTDNYDTRIYAYERDVYFAYSIRPYFYQGQKIYLNLKWRWKRFYTFSFRLSHTNYPYLDTIGSGYDLIAGNNKTEITLQVRIRW